MSSEYLIKPLIGHLAKPYIRELAELRLTVLREYPYLYDVSLGYEEQTLNTHTDSPESLIVIVFRENRIVGSSACFPPECASDEIEALFSEQGYDSARIFHFGESLLLEEFRNQGIGIRFFEEREKHVRRLGRYEYTAFRTVERPNDDPRKPSDYLSLNRFWQTRGYVRRPDLVMYSSWKDSGEESESSKTMVFWMKSLAWADLR